VQDAPSNLAKWSITGLFYPNDHPDMPGWFKGMKTILEEHIFLEEANLHAECIGFTCKDQPAAFCCRQVLFNQPDFVAPKPALFELVESHGHLAFFYPKFHCELNFIEQFWGYAKLQYRMLPRTKNEAEVDKNVQECLDCVDLLKMCR
jgi:hypothetical protein